MIRVPGLLGSVGASGTFRGSLHASSLPLNLPMLVETPSHGRPLIHPSIHPSIHSFIHSAADPCWALLERWRQQRGLVKMFSLQRVRLCQFRAIRPWASPCSCLRIHLTVYKTGMNVAPASRVVGRTVGHAGKALALSPP